MDSFATPFAVWMRQYPELQRWLTIFTIQLEAWGGYLVFLPILTSRMRLLIVPLFLALHFGIFLTMRIGPFPFISMASWIPFLPKQFWDWLSDRCLPATEPAIVLFYDGGCGFCRRGVRILKSLLLLPSLSLSPAQRFPAVHQTMKQQHSWVLRQADGSLLTRFAVFIELARQSPLLRYFVPVFRLRFIHRWGDTCYSFIAMRRDKTGWLVRGLPFRVLPKGISPLGNAIALCCLISILYWNVSGLPSVTLPRPAAYAWTMRALGINQKWNMFSPRPPHYNGWPALGGEQKNGRMVDLYDWGETFSFDRPRLFEGFFGNYRWQKYFRNLRKPGFKRYRRYLAHYLCQRWNKTHQGLEQIEKVQFFWVDLDLHPQQGPKPELRKELLTWTCKIPGKKDAPIPNR